jgi:hypothetical protein
MKCKLFGMMRGGEPPHPSPLPRGGGGGEGMGNAVSQERVENQRAR